MPCDAMRSESGTNSSVGSRIGSQMQEVWGSNPTLAGLRVSPFKASGRIGTLQSRALPLPEHHAYIYIYIYISLSLYIYIYIYMYTVITINIIMLIITIILIIIIMIIMII